MITAIVSTVKDVLRGKPLAVRSSKWHTVRAHHVAQHPICAACGRSKSLEVHHIMPYHLDKSLELEPSNLLTLCESPDTKCHLEIGHLGSWKKFNPDVVTQAAQKLASK